MLPRANPRKQSPAKTIRLARNTARDKQTLYFSRGLRGRPRRVLAVPPVLLPLPEVLAEVPVQVVVVVVRGLPRRVEVRDRRRRPHPLQGEDLEGARHLRLHDGLGGLLLRGLAAEHGDDGGSPRVENITCEARARTVD